MIDNADKVAKSIDKLAAMLSDQLKQISAEQRRTNELLKSIKRELTEEYYDGDYLPS